MNGVFLPVVVSKKVTNKFSLFSSTVWVPDPERSISYNTCRSNFKAALIEIGEDPKNFGEHSDKIGGCTAAANSEAVGPGSMEGGNLIRFIIFITRSLCSSGRRLHKIWGFNFRILSD